MRIVSLLPSATEIVCALGLADELVAVTHECDYPPQVRDKPTITASALDDAGDSATIDRLLGGAPVVSLEPRTLGDILDTIMLVGRLTGHEETAAGVVARLRARIDAVAARARSAATRPRVYCMEW